MAPLVSKVPISSRMLHLHYFPITETALNVPHAALPTTHVSWPTAPRGARLELHQDRPSGLVSLAFYPYQGPCKSWEPTAFLGVLRHAGLLLAFAFAYASVTLRLTYSMNNLTPHGTLQGRQKDRLRGWQPMQSIGCSVTNMQLMVGIESTV